MDTTPGSRFFCPSRSAYNYKKKELSSIKGFSYLSITFYNLLIDSDELFGSLSITLKDKVQLYMQILGIPSNDVLSDYIRLGYMYNTRKPTKLSLLRYRHVLNFDDSLYDQDEHFSVLHHIQTWGNNLTKDEPDQDGISIAALIYLFCYTVDSCKK